MIGAGGVPFAKFLHSGLILTLLVFNTSALAQVLDTNQQQNEIAEWLERMKQPKGDLSFRGTIVSLRQGRVDTLRIIHRTDREGVRERIYALDGPPREIVRSGGQVQCLLSNSPPLVVNNETRLNAVSAVASLAALKHQTSYRFLFKGDDRVAGRLARIIEILPRDRYRYGRRLWLDHETGLLLRSVLLDEHGQELEKISFVSIELDADISDVELQAQTMQSLVMETQLQDQEQRNLAQRVSPESPSWLPQSLPEGFQLKSAGRHETGTGVEYQQLLFSDGLASISVYVEPTSAVESAPAEQEPIESLGSMNIYSRKVDDQILTVVGDVPPATVDWVGRDFSRALSGFSAQ